MPPTDRHPPKGRGDRAATLSGHLQRTVGAVRKLTGVTLAFAGPVDLAGVRLSQFSGPVVGPLSGALLQSGCGLGGKAALAQRPIAVGDYVESRGITHQYDVIIKAEGLRSMAAVPVIVGRQSVAVVYGALRSSDTVGGRALEVLVREVRALEQQLSVERALDDSRAVAHNELFRENQLLKSSLRELEADMRRLAAVTQDPSTKRELAERLTKLQRKQELGANTVRAVGLTARELDVLTLAATGVTNAAIASSLNLTTSTVKTYMKVILSKLNASSRIDAVNRARSAGAIL